MVSLFFFRFSYTLSLYKKHTGMHDMKMISSDLEDSSKSFHLFNCYLLLLEQFIPKSIFVVIGRSRTSFMDLTDAIIKFQSLLAKGEKRTISKAEVGKFITYLQLLKHSKSGIEESAISTQ